MNLRTVSLPILLAMSLPCGAAYATSYSYLDISQTYYDTDYVSGTIPLPTYPSDTLIDTYDSKQVISTGEAKYSMGRTYESATSSVSYNNYPVLVPGGGAVGISVGPGHSATFGYGYVDTSSRIMRQSASVISNGAQFSESWTRGDMQNSFTVLPGTSGLAYGDTAKIRLDFRLDGRLTATGTSWPGNGDAFSHLLAGLTIVDPLLKIDTGEGWYTPRIVSFGADADLEAGEVYQPYWGESYSSYWSASWGAYTNTGIDMSGDYEDYYETTDNNREVTNSYNFDTGLLQLEFDAIVGHTLDFRAYMDVFSFAAGNATALTDFSSTFGPGIVDTNGTGVLIDWDVAAAPQQVPSTVPEPSTFLLLGAGLAGVFCYRRKSKRS